MPRNRRSHHCSHHRSHCIQPPRWHDLIVDMLINEQERRNDKYHNMYSRSRQEFWDSVARRYILLYMFFKKES